MGTIAMSLSLFSRFSCVSLRRVAASAATPAVLRHSFHSSAPAHGQMSLSTHKHTPENNESTPFDFTDENLEKVKQILKKYPPQYKKSAAIPVLDIPQRQHGGWLPLAAMNKTAKILGVEPMAIYEVASFYTMFIREPIGKHLVQMCTTTPCQLGGVGSDIILDAVKKHLGISPGQTTPDGKFTLIEVECLGACVNAPMMQINDDYYEDLTPETVVEVLEKLARGEKVAPGPQNSGRKTCEPYGEKTSLFTEIVNPPIRPDL